MKLVQHILHHLNMSRNHYQIITAPTRRSFIELLSLQQTIPQIISGRISAKITTPGVPYEFMNSHLRLVGVKDSDIDWKSLRNIPENYRFCVTARDAMFAGRSIRMADTGWMTMGLV